MKNNNLIITIFLIFLGIISLFIVKIGDFIEDSIVNFFNDFSVFAIFFLLIFIVIVFVFVQTKLVMKKSKVDRKTALKYVLNKFIKGKYYKK